MGRPRNRRPLQRASDVAIREQAVDRNNAELWQRTADLSVRESLGELETYLTRDQNWRAIVAIGERDFTVQGMRQIRAICRLSAISNSLIKRGLSLRSAYVHGQGVEIAARANGKNHDGEQDVQAAVNGFLTDTGNVRAYTGAGARDRLERTLGTDGEFFLALFTRPMTGDVQVRVVNADEITEIITNPDDSSDPWYYRRVWVESRYDGDRPVQVQREQFYPCVDYRPAVRPKAIGAIPVAWDSPVLHVDVNRPGHWQRGIPDAHAAINWARAYKTYLEQWATLMSSLSRFAWRSTAAGSKQAQAIRGKVAAAAPHPNETGPNAVGGMAITAADQTIEAIPKSGATIDSGSGRPLAMMVAAALDVPVTMLLADPGQTGARAVAKTLDPPMQLAMQQRREVWIAADQRVLRYIITESVRAPRGLLKGTLIRDRWRDQEILTLAGNTDDTIEIVYPVVDDTTVTEVVAAITSANSTGTIPPEVVLRLLLSALGVRDADTIIEALLGDDGAFKWPDGGPPIVFEQPPPTPVGGEPPPVQPGPEDTTD